MTKKFLKNSFFEDLYLDINKHGFGTKKWRKKFKSFPISSSIEYPAVIQNPSLITIGNNTTILKYSRLQNYSDKVPNTKGIFIGNNCFIGFNVSILNASSIRIGNSVLMASNILISSENHGMDPESKIAYMDQPLTSKPVEIKDGAWIGQNVCILPGVTIGKKSIIGAGSVVTKSIPDYSIAVGNPAHVIKKYDFKDHSWKEIK